MLQRNAGVHSMSLMNHNVLWRELWSAGFTFTTETEGLFAVVHKIGAIKRCFDRRCSDATNLCLAALSQSAEANIWDRFSFQELHWMKVRLFDRNIEFQAVRLHRGYRLFEKALRQHWLVGFPFCSDQGGLHCQHSHYYQQSAPAATLHRVAFLQWFWLYGVVQEQSKAYF